MKRFSLILIGFLIFTSGCATVPTDPQALKIYKENNDPLEPFNRAMFTFNLRADKYALRPMLRGYRAITTDGFRKTVRIFVANWKTPLTFVNTLLQTDLIKAGKALSRFTINTTLGFFGLFDVADRLGIHPNIETFSNTLTLWGVPSCPYLVLPFLGPSSVRNASALLADTALDPLTYASFDTSSKIEASLIAYSALGSISLYDSAADLLDDIKRNSLDPYAAMRTMYSQHQKASVKTTNSDGNTQKSYEFSLDDDEDE